MSNPTSVVTERRLGAFYQEILPYLGGSADAGFTPVGSVIAIMGVTAPANYLACNGQIVNVADYPELANYFEQQFGTKYKFGGSGTTFGIPNLKGQFLRGTGTNSDNTQGSGEAVGTRQKATEVPVYLTNNAETALIFPVHATGSDSTKPKLVNQDATAVASDMFGNVDFKSKTSGIATTRATTRPTNTSVLWCIATKDIYLNPAMDYSTSEKVVGKWIDGKTLYQKTFNFGALPNSASKELAHGLSIGRVISLTGVAVASNGGTLTLPDVRISGSDVEFIRLLISSAGNISIVCNTDKSNFTAYITIQYTKTT